MSSIIRVYPFSMELMIFNTFSKRMEDDTKRNVNTQKSRLLMFPANKWISI
jgi:hypothetical protein